MYNVGPNLACDNNNNQPTNQHLMHLKHPTFSLFFLLFSASDSIQSNLIQFSLVWFGSIRFKASQAERDT